MVLGFWVGTKAGLRIVSRGGLDKGLCKEIWKYKLGGSDRVNRDVVEETPPCTPAQHFNE